VRSTVTDGQGRYAINGLAAGTYVVHAAAPGFAPFDTKGFEVAAGRTVTMDIAVSYGRRRSSQCCGSAESIVNTDPANNAGALVLQKAELAALPDDPDDLAADLLAWPVQPLDPMVARFSSMDLPGPAASQQSIREIRYQPEPVRRAVRQARPGPSGNIHKPGTEDFHGNLLFQFSDAALNSRNTFVASKPPYQRRNWRANSPDHWERKRRSLPTLNGERLTRTPSSTP